MAALGFAKVDRRDLSLRLEYGTCFQRKDGRGLSSLVAPSNVTGILGAVGCEIAMAESAQSVITVKYGCLVPAEVGTDTMGDKKGTAEAFTLAKKVRTVRIPIALMSDPCAVLGLVASHIRKGRLLSICTVLNRLFAYRIPFVAIQGVELGMTHDYEIKPDSGNVLRVSAHGLTVADLAVTKSGRLVLTFSDARTDRTDEFYHFCVSRVVSKPDRTRSSRTET